MSTADTKKILGSVFFDPPDFSGASTPLQCAAMTSPVPRFSAWMTAIGLCVGTGSVSGGDSPAASVRGPGSVPIEVRTSAATLATRTGPDGTRIHELAPATDIREGQEVYYTLTIRNPGSQPAHGVLVTKPVPANTRYVAGSAVAPNATVTFSIDGGQTFAPASDLVVGEGRAGASPATPELYTHIRWQLRYPLAPGAVAYARFRAVFQ